MENIMNYDEKHSRQLVDEINKIWCYDSILLISIANALAKRNSNKPFKEPMTNEITKDNISDYLMNQTTNDDLKTIIEFIKA